MHPQPLLKFTRLFRILVLLTNISYLLKPSAAGATDETECEPCSCGNVNISYPFWLSSEQPPDCGHPDFKVACKDNSTILVLPPPFDNSFSIRQIFYNHNSFLVTSTKFTNDCPIPHHLDVQFPPGDHFRNSSANGELVFYTCSTLPSWTPPPSMEKTCADGIFACYGGNYSSPSPPTPPSRCEQLATVPVLRHDHEDKSISRDLATLLKDGFLVEWADVGNCAECTAPAGKCTSYYGAFPCMCPGGRPDDRNCKNNTAYSAAPHTKEASHRKQIVTGVCAGVGGLVIASFLCFFYHYCRKRKQPSSSILLPRNASSESMPQKDLELGSEQYHTQIFQYEELEDATDGFSPSNELGDGGFGTVFKGKLRDGRTVAIKRFKNRYRRVEQFVNEIHILSSFRHPNLVTLYGCTSRHSRELLLVYEYVPNGTVADHLHGSRVSEEALTWHVRVRIAIETAEALSYLHAVTPQIIHRDVKTNNILLDRNFHVKVADFGLSRLFPVNVTHVSTSPQGTPGYLDPEYHQCYQLTDKSDVYSFGVVLVELLSSKPAVDLSRQPNEINLAKMAMNKIRNQEVDQLVDPTLWHQLSRETRTMITQVAEVAFRCLQAEREMRPTIREVLLALRGIQDEGCSRRARSVEADAVVNDEDCLLRKKPPPSPDTVTEKWESRSPSNSSG